MPGDIVSEKFVATRNLTVEELNTLVIKTLSKEDIAAKLASGGWSATAGAVITAQLFEDNSRIRDISLALVGKLEGTWNSATRFWPTLPAVFKFKLTLNLDRFNFSDGLHSDIMDVTNDCVEIKNGDTTMTLEDLKEAGGSNICIRLVCYPSHQDFMKIYCLAFPYSVTDLIAAHPQATSPSFPGILCANKDVEWATATPSSLKWGNPFFPLVRKGSADRPMNNLSCLDLRTKIAKFLRAAVKGQSSNGIAQLTEKWAAIARDVEGQLNPSIPGELWPMALEVMPASANLHEEENNIRKLIYYTRPESLNYSTANLVLE